MTDDTPLPFDLPSVRRKKLTGWSRLCFFPWHRRPGSHVKLNFGDAQLESIHYGFYKGQDF
jgi:hypothetical protein